MFINTAKFKKMLKNAYNGQGLLMSRNEDTLLLGGGSWLISTSIEKMTRKEKAAVIELVGKFPDIHETFRATCEGEQQEIPFIGIAELKQEFESGQTDFGFTYVLIDTPDGMIRAAQSDRDNYVIWINEFLRDAISYAAMTGWETVPQGPRYAGNGIIWKNNICTYKILRYDLKNYEFSKLMENMEFRCLSTK